MPPRTSTWRRSAGRRWWGVLLPPVIAGLSLAGAGTAVADHPDSTLTVGIPNVRVRSGVVNNRLMLGPTQVIDEVRFGVIDRREPGARFGAAILSGYDLDPKLRTGNGEDDLIVGAPGTPGSRATGRVEIFFGSRSGFRARNTRVLENHAKAGDEFGAALSISSREEGSTGIRDLWVGAPGHDVAGKADAGAVFRYEISATGVPTYVETITQDNPMLIGEAEAGDRFGEVLGGDGVVGVPGEDVGPLKDAGIVQFLNIDEETGKLIAAPTYTQGLGHFQDVAEAGDRFGAAIWGNAIGVPGEDVGTIKDAGAVQMFNGVLYTQNTPGIPGKAESGDHFGAALSLGYRLQTRSGPPSECDEMSSVAVGIPGEDVGAAKDAGSIVLMSSGFEPINLKPGREYCPPRMFSQGHGLPGKAEIGDHLGAALGVRLGDPEQGNRRRDILLIGVPGENVGTTKDVGRVIAGTGKSAKSFGYSGGNISRMRFGTVLPSGNWSF